MKDPDKPVDLPPHEPESDREKPKEPFWGPGLPDFLTELFLLVLVIFVLYLAKPLIGDVRIPPAFFSMPKK
ncbi:hypothetical protein V1291_005294 [Nitrobacteraceae bacterium AZCC 1564]